MNRNLRRRADAHDSILIKIILINPAVGHRLMRQGGRAGETFDAPLNC
jgi:hypothetical protein